MDLRHLSVSRHFCLFLQAIWHFVLLCLASIMPKKRSRNYYAVRRGRNPGVYETWEDCNRQVDGYQGNKYKSFPTRSEAEEYMRDLSSEIPTNPKQESSKSSKVSPVLNRKSSTNHLEADKHVKDFAKAPPKFVSVDQAGSQSLPASSLPKIECFKDCTNVSSADSAEVIRGQQKVPQEKTEFLREDGEFAYFKDEAELESYLATFLDFDARSNSVKHSFVPQTFDAAELWEFNGICQLEFDGASKGNPGKAGAGALLRCPHGSVVWKRMEFLGCATSNVAEYSALIMGLKGAMSRGVKKVRVQTDSQLVCLQVRGAWQVKDTKMIELCKTATELKKSFKEFSIINVDRKFNSMADALANSAVRLEGSELTCEIIEPIPKCCQK